MTSDSGERWHWVKAIFTEAVESTDREAVISRLAGHDNDVIQEVRGLLAMHDEGGLAIDHPAYGDSRRHTEGELLAGRFRIRRFLASGGMGDVYQALDEHTGGDVAIKFVRAISSDNPATEERFRREVDFARRVQHPNVCQVWELASQGNETFCVMELLTGEPLSRRLERNVVLSPEEALRVALALCDALQAAHSQGIVHRDIKPGNVFLEPERVVLIDFGLAAAAAKDGSLTAASVVIGTLAYMAPELLEGKAATARSDIFAFGVLLFEMLTGSKPYSPRSPFRMAAEKARGAHPLSRAGGTRAMPEMWREVITRCLKPKPEDRFTSVVELRRILEQGRPTLGFRLRQPLIQIPLGVGTTLVFGCAGWFGATRDYKPLPEPARLYSEAHEAMAQAAPERAAQSLAWAVGLDPGFIQAYALLAIAHSERDQSEEAQKAVLLATAAAERRWLLGRGERAFLQAARATVIRDHAGAAGFFDRLAAGSRGRERIQALMALGSAQVQAGNAAAATATYERVLWEDPLNAAARVRLAAILARRGDLNRSAREFARAEQEHRSRSNMYGLADTLLARATLIRSRTADEAERDLREVIAISRRLGSPYYELSAQLGLSNVAVSRHKLDEAVGLMQSTVERAGREGFPTIAATAQSELGYLHHYRREPQKALTLLREALAMAQRSRSRAAEANTRMRLGETLGQLHQVEAAQEVMAPAIQWYRRGGHEDLLPFILVKWGTVLWASRQPRNAVPVFEEALELATRNGDEMYQSIALQRLSSCFHWVNLRQAAGYVRRAEPLALKLGHLKLQIGAAATYAMLGEDADRTDALFDGVETALRQYREGPFKQEVRSLLFTWKAKIAYSQGRCDEALRWQDQAGTLPAYDQHARRLLEVCAGRPLGPHLAWARALQEADPRVWAIAAGIALRGGDRPLAIRLANRSMEVTREQGFHVFELEAALILRAAEGTHRLTARCLELSRLSGFDPPEQFGKRQDLLSYWRAVR